MKHIILVLFVIFNVTVATAQYNKWLLDAEFGKNKILDESAVSTGNNNHVGIGVRYNFNPYVGVGLSSGYDKSILEDINKLNVNLNYSRLNVESYINIFNLLNLQNKVFTAVVHGGPGIARINTDNNYSQNIFNLRYGLTGLIKISSKLCLKADFSSSDNFSQSNTIDGSFLIGNTGVNSMIRNVSVGLSYSFGKENSDHADWYKQKPARQTVIVKADTTIINKYNNEYVTKQFIVADSICSSHEYLFFDNNSPEIRKESLNAIYKIFVTLILDPKASLEIKGWASATSDGDKENLLLSKARAMEVRKKYIDMGIDVERIRIIANGKDVDLKPDNVHDIARRVELHIVKQ